MSTQVGAFLTQPTAWQEINWSACYKTVERLQARIVKATKDGKWGKVRSLQWILTHSFSAKALAVRRVTENKGRKTPGIDGKTWSTPLEKTQAITKLNRRRYHPSPVRRIYIPKANGKLRPLGILTMQDRAMQALYLLSLDPVAETTADATSYGFRPKRSTADAIANCFYRLSKLTSAQWILDADIQACFDRVDHTWLIKHIPIDKQVLDKWLQAGYIESGQYVPTKQGTQQGGIISPVLANMTLDGLDKKLKNCQSLKGKKVCLVRYADDFIITGVNKEILEQTVRPLVEEFLKERGLNLSEQKTRTVHIHEGFDFLGQNIRKYGNKLLIKPSKKSRESLLKRVKALLKENRSISSYDLIKKLNPILRGWGYYHNHIVSKRIFSKMDHLIYHQIWKWCVSRHPKKSREWVRRKYFWSGNNWGPFRGEQKLSTGKTSKVKLERLGYIKIVRHKLIKGEANPYWPLWKNYFEQRQKKEVEMNSNHKGLTLKIWQKQKGICPVCQQPIGERRQLDKHHILPRKDGGVDKLDNLMLLHPTCHKQLHSNKAVADSIKAKIGFKEARA